MRLGFPSLLLVCATLDLAVAVRAAEGLGGEVGDAMAPPCQSSLTASATLPAKVPPAGLRLQVCRNEECDVYDLAGAPLAFKAPSACDGDCYVQDGVVQVSRSLVLPTRVEPADTYDVRLFDPVTERTFAASHGRLVYASVPAVATADVRMGECRAAEVSARSLEGS